MDPPAEASLDQILATIPPQNQPMLNQKISDIHLANIARSLTNWSSVCVNLGIDEAEEEAIVADNRTVDGRRYVPTALRGLQRALVVLACSILHVP